MSAGYPKRPRFFSHRFCRLMGKVCLANEVGAEACWMLALVVNTEDAKGYRGAVTFFNAQLMQLAGIKNVKALGRVRARCVEAGWLHYEAGTKGRAGKYWVSIPERFQAWDDGPSDERAGKYGGDEHGGFGGDIDAESGAESATNVGENPPQKRGRIRHTSGQHSSLSLSLSLPRAAAGAAAAPTVPPAPPPPPPPEPVRRPDAVAFRRWDGRVPAGYIDELVRRWNAAPGRTANRADCNGLVSVLAAVAESDLSPDEARADPCGWLLRRVDAYVASQQAREDGGRFRPTLARWLKPREGRACRALEPDEAWARFGDGNTREQSDEAARLKAVADTVERTLARG